MQDDDERVVLERRKFEDSRPWAGAKEWTQLSEVIARIRARNERLLGDPRFREAEKKMNWVRENPIFKGVELKRVFADPYVVIQEVKHQDVRDTRRAADGEEVPIDGTSNPSKVAQNAQWRTTGEAFARRDAALLVETHRRFREFFAADLPTLADKGRMLTGLVMWDKSSFVELLREAGDTSMASARAFYSPQQQKFFTYVGVESLQRLDELPCEGGFTQKESDQVLAYCAALQLRHEYSAIARGRPLVDSDTRAEPMRAAWFDSGLAELLSAVETNADAPPDLAGAKWRHERVPLASVDAAQRLRAHAERWTIEELLKPANLEAVFVEAARLDGPSGATIASCFTIRAGALCHFLWNYDDGKYRQAFLDFVRLSLAGPATSSEFAKLMKRKNASEWGDVEMEFAWYWDRLLDRRSGKDAKTGEWFTPSTDAPTGRVEDEFVRAWRSKPRPK